MKKIQFRFDELRAKKEREDDRRYSLKDVSKLCGEIDLKENLTRNKTFKGEKVRGISVTTLDRISRNETKQIHLSTINLLCEFFECDIGDLIIRVG